jgi:hypothetical protein
MESIIKFIVKTIRVAFLAILLISCSSEKMELSEKSKNRIELEVRKSFEALIEASKALDTKRYFEFIDEDKFIGLNADGTNWNSVDDLKVMIESGFSAVEKIEFLEFTNVHVSVIDLNTAILVNEYSQKVLLKSGISINDAGGGTQVWSKVSGEWLLVSISASSKQ